MEQKHPYFDVHTYDRSYTAVRRSFELTPNEKALISHIITWQEATDEKGNLLNRVCFESNSTLSEELGIPFDTLEKLIKNMKKKYNFFSAESLPGKGKSKKNGNWNRTIKRINMEFLVEFLNDEKAKRELESEQATTTRPNKQKAQDKPVIAPEPMQLSQSQVSSNGTIQPVEEPWTEYRTHLLCKRWVEELNLEKDSRFGYWKDVAMHFQDKVRKELRLDFDRSMDVQSWAFDYCKKNVQPLFLVGENN